MRSGMLVPIAIASAIGCFPCSELRAEPGYKSKSGKIGFHVDTNVPFLKVSGSSSGVKGGGEASVAGDVATIRNLRFEVDPKTFKTGIALRDQHMYEQVSPPTVRFQPSLCAPTALMRGAIPRHRNGKPLFRL